MERIQLIDAVLNLCTYHHPENIQLPVGYVSGLSCFSNKLIGHTDRNNKWLILFKVPTT